MMNFILSLVWIVLTSITHISLAADTTTILWLSSGDSKLRSGDFSFSDIPVVIVGVTDFFLYFASAIAVVVIIYWAVKMQLHSGAFGSNNHEEWKKTITAGIIGFAISISAWFIVKKFVEIISGQV